jgi:hypothetical protein
VPAAILDVRPVTQPIRRRNVGHVNEWQVFGVLLVRAGGHGLDASFEYVGERLPAIGDEIEITHPFVAHSLDAGPPVRAKVTGVEPDKTRPIRATEL